MHLTKTLIEKTPYPANKVGGAFYLWHDDPRGLGVRIYPSGLRSWVVTYRQKGRRRFQTLGPVGVLTLDKARQMAIQILGRLYEIRSTQVMSLDAGNAALDLTVKQLGQRYLEEHGPKLKAKTRYSYATLARLHLYKAFGHHPAVAVEREDVLRLRKSLKEFPNTANQSISLLNRMYIWGEETGAVPVGTNPCKAIPKFPANRRNRFLSPEELRRLAAALQWAEEETETSPYSIAAIKALLLTGCRRNEIRTLKWDYIDFENGCLDFPDSKTGEKSVPVGSAVLDLFRSLKRVEGNEYVFVGLKPGKPLAQLTCAWTMIRDKAELENLTIHDLRHTFATNASADGMEMETIRRLLVHQDVTTTRSYVHVIPKPSREDREAAEKASRALVQKMAACG